MMDKLIEFTPTTWAEVEVGHAVRVAYPDGAILLGKLRSEPADHGHIVLVDLDLGDRLGVLKVDVKATRVWRISTTG